MTDSKDSFHAPFKIVGYLVPDADPPTFVMPVFRNLENDTFAIQVSDFSDRISCFDQVGSQCTKISSGKSFIRKIGDPTVFGLIDSGGKFICYPRSDFVSVLRGLLDRGEFEQVPAFGLSVAKFINDLPQEKRFKKAVYNETPQELYKTRKFFLENNIVREDLYGKMPAEYSELIKKIRINIVGNKVRLRTPDGTQQSQIESIAAEVRKTFKEFVDSSNFNIEIESQSKVDIENLMRDIREIKKGNFDYSPDILDYPNAKFLFSAREAIIVMPDAASHYYGYANNVFGRDKSIDVKNLVSTISDNTIRKILRIESVSLISAILFRYRLAGNMRDALSLDDMRMHVACFKLNIDSLDDEVIERLKNNFYTSRKGASFDSLKRSTLITFSMLMFMIHSGLISDNDAKKHAKFDRNGYYSPYRLDSSFLQGWIYYCRGSFWARDRELMQFFGAPELIEKQAGTI